MARLPVVIADCYEVQVFGESYNNPVSNTFHYWHPGGASAADCQTIAFYWRDHLLAYMLNALSANYHALSIEVRDLTAAGRAEYVLPLIGPYVGTRSGVPLPGSITSAIHWTCARAGRSYRGRDSIGPLSHDDVIGDSIQAGEINLLHLLAQALIAFPPLAGSGLAVGSVKLHVATLITGFILDFIVDAMRRRVTPG